MSVNWHSYKLSNKSLKNVYKLLVNGMNRTLWSKYVSLLKRKTSRISLSCIQHLADELNGVQNEMMNKISDVQELKLVLHGLRSDQGSDLNTDLEQVTIELKLDEVVRQHIIKLKQQASDDDVGNELTFEQALTDAVSSSGKEEGKKEKSERGRKILPLLSSLMFVFKHPLIIDFIVPSRLLFFFITYRMMVVVAFGFLCVCCLFIFRRANNGIDIVFV